MRPADTLSIYFVSFYRDKRLFFGISSITVDNMGVQAFCSAPLFVTLRCSNFRESVDSNGGSTPLRLWMKGRSRFISWSLRGSNWARGMRVSEINHCGKPCATGGISMSTGGEDSKQGVNDDKVSDSESVVGVSNGDDQKGISSGTDSGKRQYSLRTRLREETEAPFRKARMFIYAGSAASAGVGAFISTLRIISALVGTRGIQPLSETVRDTLDAQPHISSRQKRVKKAMSIPIVSN